MSEIYHNQKVFSLNEVLASVGKTLAARYQRAYWMKAEMNKLNYYTYSGHCYPDLVEKQEGKVIAQTRAIIWNSTFQEINKKFLDILKEPLKDGINILFLARITFTSLHGLSLQILDIDPSFSLGLLEREKLENISRLKREGLFYLNKKLAMPMLPQRVAVISVETSKGYADFIKIIHHNPSGYHVSLQLFPARLQGDGAINDIILQLQKIEAHAGLFDVAAIIRGGGGEVGLAAFNDYKLARTIAKFPMPVLTGIGHATNETIAEMVAFKNAITPTECAQFLLDQFEKADRSLQQALLKLNSIVRRKVDIEQYLLQQRGEALTYATRHLTGQHELKLKFNNKLINNYCNRFLENNKAAAQTLMRNLAVLTKTLIKEEDKRLSQLEKNLALINPENVLKRGYSITRINGKCILPEDTLPKEGQVLETELYQGKLKSITTK
ncbi:MAG TPA: exodeoxyribonuclease VII large subunit [Edaphocola sp.]|nr:exodeoxyribonuclease VII large subunit [Edaphocola sp.]